MIDDGVNRGIEVEELVVKGRKIKVLVVDNHPMVCKGLARILRDEPDIDVIGTIPNTLDAIKQALELKPDVVTVDAFVPDSSFAESNLPMIMKSPGVRVLVLTASERDDNFFEAVDSGVQNYLIKSAKLSELADGVRRTAAGEPMLSPQLIARLMTRLRKGRDTESTLKDMDARLLRLLRKGLSVREIARDMGIGTVAVQNYIRRIIEKLSALESDVRS